MATNKDIALKCAKNEGYVGVEFLGVLEETGEEVYNPINEQVLYTGMPEYILVLNGKAEMVVENDFIITERFFGDTHLNQD